MAYRTGLLKARGRRKGQNCFWPVAVEQRQKWAGCSACVCCVVLCVRARALPLAVGQERRTEGVGCKCSSPVYTGRSACTHMHKRGQVREGGSTHSS